MTRQSLTRVTRLFLCLGLLTLAPAVSRAAPAAEDFKRCRPRAPKPADDSLPMAPGFSELLLRQMQEPEPAAPEAGGEPGTTVSGRVFGLTSRDDRQEVYVLVQGNPLIQKERAFFVQLLGTGGRFRMEDVPPGVWTVIADAGNRHAAARTVVLTPGQREEVVDLELPPWADFRPVPGWPEPARLEVKVVDRAGRPVSGATVHAGLADFGPLQFALTGEGGMVRLGTQPSNQTLWLFVERPGLVSEVREVLLRPGEARSLQVTLFPGVRVEGRVVNESGWPVAGAEVVLSGHLLGPELPGDPTGFLSSRETLRTTTSRTGRFRFEALPEGDVTLLLQHPSYAALREVRQIDRGDLGKIVLHRGGRPAEPRIRPGATLRGRVLDPYGRPLRGAKVTAGPAKLSPWDLPGLASSQAATDSEGRFSVGPLRPDIYDLEARADGLLSGHVRKLRAEADTVRDGIEIRLQSAAVVSGRVVDPHGTPVQGAIVGTLTAETRSRADGSFRLASVPFGKSSFSVKTYAGYEDLQREIEITTGVAWVDFVLNERSGRITVPARGRVTGPGGAPVGGALVTTSTGARSWTADDGSFEVQLQANDRQEITARRRGFAASTIPVNPEGAPVDGLEIRLGPESVVTGRVLGLAAGEPDPSARVALSAMPEISGVLAADGTFRLRGVPAGTWELSTRVAYRQAGATITVPPGPAEVRADLHLPPTHPVSGQVLDALSRPVARAEVEAYRDNQSTRVATGADGSFHLDLPDGSYLLSAEKPGFRKDGYQKLQVQGTEVVDLQLHLKPDTSATLTGHLRGLGATERPVLRARALRHERSPSELTAEVELDTYTLTGLEPGLWSLEAQSAACTVRRTIEIPAGASKITLDLDLAEEEQAQRP